MLWENFIERVINPSKRVKCYSKEEISNAIVIHTQSPKAYETMRRNSMICTPLPNPRTLSRHISHFLCAPGLQPEFFAMLGAKLSSEDWIGRQSVLVFDEMHVKECYEYDKRLKTVMGGSKTVQVVLIRNIKRNSIILLKIKLNYTVMGPFINLVTTPSFL